jgi:glyceraldehyde 3-phosphate dehydrogenase
MTVKVGINGLGRIGRLVFRGLFEKSYPNLELVCVNGPATIETHQHLIQFDSVHGIFSKDVKIKNENTFEIEGKEVRLFRERDPSNIPWGKMGVDIVFECTGHFLTVESVQSHFNSGAKKVMFSAPSKDKTVKTIVYGVNDKNLSKDDKIISIGSCTTNCLAPIAKVLNDNFRIESGIMTTIHAYTGDQNNVDSSHKDLRRARACGLSMVPTSTGAAKALGLVLPELNGKLTGSAIRVPTANVSVVDLTFIASKKITKEDMNTAFINESNESMKGVLGCEKRPLVSIDFCGNDNSSIVDLSETNVINNKLGRVLSWYDNEWGFSMRMLDVASKWN